MSLTETINADVKNAMLARDKKKLEALRAIKAALLLVKTGKDRSSGEIPEDVELALLQKLVKQRKEAAEVFKSQNRDDLVRVELYQAGIIEQYLPEQMGEEEVRGIIEKIISETGASNMKDMGRVMGLTSTAVAGKADNKMVAGIVKDILSK